MNAVERLRAALDEHGIPYDTAYEVFSDNPATVTEWYVGGRRYVADTWDSSDYVSLHLLTPEQAVAATLGGVAGLEGRVARIERLLSHKTRG